MKEKKERAIHHRPPGTTAYVSVRTVFARADCRVFFKIPRNRMDCLAHSFSSPECETTAATTTTKKRTERKKWILIFNENVYSVRSSVAHVCRDSRLNERHELKCEHPCVNNLLGWQKGKKVSFSFRRFPLWWQRLLVDTEHGTQNSIYLNRTR